MIYEASPVRANALAKGVFCPDCLDGILQTPLTRTTTKKRKNAVVGSTDSYHSSETLKGCMPLYRLLLEQSTGFELASSDPVRFRPFSR